VISFQIPLLFYSLKCYYSIFAQTLPLLLRFIQGGLRVRDELAAYIFTVAGNRRGDVVQSGTLGVVVAVIRKAQIEVVVDERGPVTEVVHDVHPDVGVGCGTPNDFVHLAQQLLALFTRVDVPGRLHDRADQGVEEDAQLDVGVIVMTSLLVGNHQ
jgi:hypothetical protein